MKIYLAADHAGFELKEKIKVWLKETGYDISDEGAFKLDPSDDYPDYVKVVALQVSSDQSSRGLVFGGSGQGEAIMANRYQGVRAVVYYGAIAPHLPVDVGGRFGQDDLEIVRLTREHNNANVLSIGARFVNEVSAKEVISLWLQTEFSQAERHIRRLKKLDDLKSDENIF